jgi:hypothetical protein
VERVPTKLNVCALILLEPEELLRGGDGIRVRTRRARKIGERAGAQGGHG